MTGVTCARCGTVADPPPLTWTTQSSDRGLEWLCEACAREHIRSIEGRLDTDWW